MKKTINLFLLILFISCGGKGVEGNVGQIISISAEENLEEPDTDYNWIIINQPDGSLLSPKDLKYNNNGQEMVFSPDYPGDYTFEVSITKFGDELSSQSFFFSISDPENLESSEAFLKANKSKEGIKVLASGLQYKVTKQGVGRTPKATDTVVVHYKGTLLDGTEFDSSYKRNQPAEFKVTQVIKGWTEALQKMNVGSKWTLYIPPNLAYGTQGAGRLIGPNQALIFDVELIRIK